MASQTITRAQSVFGALRIGHVANSSMVQVAAPVMRPSQASAFAPQRAVAVRARNVATVTAAAGNGTTPGGLPIDLRGKPESHFNYCIKVLNGYMK